GKPKWATGSGVRTLVEYALGQYLVDGDLHDAVGYFDLIRRQPDVWVHHIAPRRHVVLKPAPRARHDRALEVAFTDVTAAVQTHAVHRVARPVHVEQRDHVIAQQQLFARPGRDLVGARNRFEVAHRRNCSRSTTARPWVARPIGVSPSYASHSNVSARP